MTEHGTNEPTAQMESYRRSYEPNVEKLKAQPAGATGGGDHGREMACEEFFQPSPELLTVACRPFAGRQADTRIPGQLSCELQSGHQGLHTAQIQAWGDDEAWAEWGTGASYAIPRFFNAETVCNAVGVCVEFGEDDAVCTLPEFHPGAHSFELRHTHSEGRDMSPEKEAKFARLMEEED